VANAAAVPAAAPLRKLRRGMVSSAIASPLLVTASQAVRRRAIALGARDLRRSAKQV
jgi:hypothetical protein